MCPATPSQPYGSPVPADDDLPDALLRDPARLAAVQRVLAPLDDRTGLDRLTRLTALLLDAPYAQVSVLGERQEVVSSAGRPPHEPRTSPLGDSLCTVTLVAGRPTAIDDVHADRRVARLRPVAEGGVQAYLGVPLVDADGQRLGALCAYDSRVRPWSQAQVDIITELAGSVVAELELRAVTGEASSSATRLGLALEAAEMGSFDLDVATGEIVWDERLIRLFGYDADTFVPHVDSAFARIHGEDVERVRQAIEHAGRTGGEFSSEYRVQHPGGQLRWVQARGSVLRRGGHDHLLGVAYDSTEVHDVRSRLGRVLETMTDAFYSVDRDWRFTYVNRQAEVLLHRRRDELLGRSIWEAFPETLDSPFEERYRHAVAADEPVAFEAPFDPLGGWYEVAAWPGPDGLSVYFREITVRRRELEDRERAYAEREQAVVERERAYASAAAANTRLALLADASTRLAASLEPRQVLERIGELVVPDLGQWVVVALAAETAASLLGTEAPLDSAVVEVVHVAHAHAEHRAPLEAAVRRLPLSTRDRVGVGAVVRTGEPEWLPRVDQAAVASLAPDAEALAALQRIEPVQALTVPLSNRGRVLGAMTIAEPSGGPVDRSLLGDLAARAAVALENALLFGAERRNGITLQRSLLPRRVPAVDGMLMAARYLPGASGAFVGGDWYQGVRVGDGIVLAMGDVMGHGMRSAARMGQLRAIVATLALEGHGPAALLTRLAASVDDLLDLELATLLVAAYDPDGRTLTVASAGHPPPLLAPLDEPPRFLDVEPGPPLGAFPTTYDEVRFPLPDASTLVLYTDGLVENRTESIDVGLERLRRALVDVRLPPERVCDHVLDVLGRRGGGDDDVALLVLSHLGDLAGG